MKNLLPFIENVQVASFMIKKEPYSNISITGKYVYSLLREAAKLYTFRQELSSLQVVSTMNELEEVFQTSRDYLNQALVELKHFGLIKFSFKDHTCEIMFIEESNNAPINENTRHSTTNSTEQSINSMKLPTLIQRAVLKHDDRLEKDNIKIKDIEEHYEYHKHLLTEEAYASVIDFCLAKTNGTIKQIKAVLTTGVNNKLKQINSSYSAEANNKKDIVPSWIDNDHSSSDKINTKNTDSNKDYKYQFEKMMEYRNKQRNSN